MPESVEVLRMLRYTYPDAETMVQDMGNWGIPACGVRARGVAKGASISSAVLTPAMTSKESAEAMVDRVVEYVMNELVGVISAELVQQIDPQQIANAVIDGFAGSDHA